MTVRADTLRRLHELPDFATDGGADSEWLEETLSLLAAALLDRVDPRRRRSLKRAADIERAAADGASSAELAERFGLSDRVLGAETPRSIVGRNWDAHAH